MQTSNVLAENVPDLEPGVTLLTTPKHRSAALQQLVVSHSLDGQTRQAWWIDSANSFTTHSLLELAPSKRVLEHLQISRAFTGYQQASLVQETVQRTTPLTELVVASNMPHFYRDREVPELTAERLLEATTSLLAELSRACSLPVLVTTYSAVDDQSTEMVRDVANRELHARTTSQGIHYEGDGFKTEVYWVGEGLMQTTIPYWVRLLGVLDETGGEGVFESPAQVETPKLDAWG